MRKPKLIIAWCIVLAPVVALLGVGIYCEPFMVVVLAMCALWIGALFYALGKSEDSADGW